MGPWPLPISGLVDVDHLGDAPKGAAWSIIAPPWMLPFPALPRALACTSTDGDPTSQHGELPGGRPAFHGLTSHPQHLLTTEDHSQGL